MLSVHLFICVLCAFSLQSTENIVVENIIFWQKIFDIDDTVDRKSFCTIKRIYQCFETFTNWKRKPIPHFLSNESSLQLFISISSLYNTVWTLYRYLTLEEWFYLSTQKNILLFLFFYHLVSALVTNSHIFRTKMTFRPVCIFRTSSISIG